MSEPLFLCGLAMAAFSVDQDRARGERAAQRVRARGGSAIDAALAAIEATFSRAIRHSTFKRRVAALVRGGPGHPAMRSRYQRLAERYPCANLDTAITIVERLYRAEIDARAAAVRLWGRCSRPRVALMLLQELRLMLRMVRRHAPMRYPGLVAAVLAEDAENFRELPAEAAE
jgi:hypothetical protein